MSHTKTKYLRFKLFALLPFLVAASLVFASPSSPVMACTGTQVALHGDSHTCCPRGSEGSASDCLYAKYVNPTIDLLSAAVGIVATIGIIVGAIQFSSSGGDPQQAATGKKHIRNALVGLVVYLLLYAFLQFIVPGGKLNG